MSFPYLVLAGRRVLVRQGQRKLVRAFCCVYKMCRFVRAQKCKMNMYVSARMCARTTIMTIIFTCMHVRVRARVCVYNILATELKTLCQGLGARERLSTAGHRARANTCERARA